MLLFGVIFIAGYLFSSLSQTRHALDNRAGLQGFLFLTLGIYFTWFWHKGQTLAMKTWHIKVVSISGAPLTQPRALLRYVLSWVWFLPPLLLTLPLGVPADVAALLLCAWIIFWALLSKFQAEKQFWHDIWAGTRLITSR